MTAKQQYNSMLGKRKFQEVCLAQEKNRLNAYKHPLFANIRSCGLKMPEHCIGFLIPASADVMLQKNFELIPRPDGSYEWVLKLEKEAVTANDHDSTQESKDYLADFFFGGAGKVGLYFKGKPVLKATTVWDDGHNYYVSFRYLCPNKFCL